MREKRALKLGRQDREAAVSALRQYLADEFDVEVGDLKVGFLLDFFLREIGPTIYNGAIAEARAYFAERADDLEGVLHLPEFPCSKARE